MAENQDSEIILGTGKLLGLFFGLVVICALFFGLGYSWGKKSAQPSPLQLSGTTDSGEPASGDKPSAAATSSGTTATNCPNGNCSGDANSVPAAPVNVGLMQPQPDLHVQSPAATASQPAPAAQPSAAPAKASAPPEMARSIAPGTGYTVQVAAVSKQEDAEALVSALRKKQYPVFISPGTQSDRYFHVQVGPFPDEKQAEAMKTKLLGDGYNAIVKK